MIKVKATKPGRTEKSTVVVVGYIASLPKLNTALVVKEGHNVLFETDPIEGIIHHVKDNAYTVKIGRHKIKVELLKEEDTQTTKKEAVETSEEETSQEPVVSTEATQEVETSTVDETKEPS